jgi:hypothetical protein
MDKETLNKSSYIHKRRLNSLQYPSGLPKPVSQIKDYLATIFKEQCLNPASFEQPKPVRPTMRTLLQTLLYTSTNCVALCFSSIALAANICVAPVATGDGSGSNWNNRASWANIAFTRGNTYYLMEGSYGGKALNVPASGVTPIAIKKCAVGEPTCTAIAGWQATLGDGEAVFNGTFSIATSYWEINGTTGGGPGAWKSGHGFKWTSNAGTSMEYISINDGVSNVIVSHAKFEQVGNTEAVTGRADGIYDAGALLNSRIEYSYFENLGGLPFLLRAGSGNIIQYNYSGNICGMSVKDFNQHCEGLVIHGMGDLHFRWNFIAESPSSGGFVKNNTQTSDSVRIYGNVFGNGFPINCNTGTCTNWRIFNNTFYNVTSGPVGGDGTKTNLMIYNNIIYKANTSGLPTSQHGYNWYSKASPSCSMGGLSSENITVLYPNNCDAIAEASDPFKNSLGTNPEDMRLAKLIANWPGLNVCTLDACTGEKKYNTDAFGLVRGKDGVWDRGAFEYQAGTVMIAPTNLRATP